MLSSAAFRAIDSSDAPSPSAIRRRRCCRRRYRATYRSARSDGCAGCRRAWRRAVRCRGGDGWLKKCVRNSTAMQSSCLERMRQQQQLALGVEPSALHTPRVPGRADLDAAVRGVHVHIRGHAGDAAGRRRAPSTAASTLAACNARRRAISASIFSGDGIDVYHSVHSSPSRTASISPSRCDGCQRLQRRMRTAERHRFEPGHWYHFLLGTWI